jgi:hypothetical protein
MRQAPQMRAEVAGVIVTRPGVPVVLQRDAAGNPTIVHMQPQLEPGELLLERLGTIPAIVMKEPAMSDSKDVYRHQIVRSVLGTHPAILAKEADPEALDGICRHLVDAEDAKALLRAHGCGRYTDSLASMVRMLLEDRGRKRA